LDVSGGSFEKLQTAARTRVAFTETLPDGTNLRNPVRFVQVEVGYPDFAQPVGPDGKANVLFHAQGRRSAGHKELGAPEIARWTEDSATDTILFSFLKLAVPAADFDPDEVIIRKTIAYDAGDPRLFLSSGGSIFVRELRTREHCPIIDTSEIAHINVKFVCERHVPNESMTMRLTCIVGDHRSTFAITHHSENIVWELFSDKFVDATSFTYTLEVEVVGPNFTDVPIRFGTPVPVAVALPTGCDKYISPFALPLPPIPQDKRDAIKRLGKAGLLE
jgi:hypothetical protein